MKRSGRDIGRPKGQDRAGTSRATVSLVLGSGGARGLAHIGVIRWLEENGYAVRSISGSSIGALIGGIYAAGKLDEYEQWVRTVTKVDMVRMLDLSWTTSGLVKGDKIINALIGLVGDQLIEDLPVRFTAVATDIKDQREVWITSGRLFDAIRASMSVPLLFTPVQREGIVLIDGGVLDPVPVAPTMGDDTDMTIAVDLGGPEEDRDPPAPANAASDPSSPTVRERLNQFISLLQGTVSGSEDRDWGVYDIAIEAFEAMQSAIARQKLAAFPPDAVIEIARNACRSLEYDRAADMIELGYRKAMERLSGAGPRRTGKRP